MKLKDLVNKVSEKAGITKVAARAAIDAFVDTVKGMEVGDRLILKGFGTFTKYKRKARTARIGGVMRVIKEKDKLKFKSHI